MKFLFITIILISLVLIGASCEDSTTTGAAKPSRLRETQGVQNRVLHIHYDEYNCEDFETWEKTQKVFESFGGTENDVHHLDSDNDGIACEVLR